MTDNETKERAEHILQVALNEVNDLKQRVALLEAKVAALEQKPDIAFLRTMKERMEDIEIQLKPSGPVQYGAPWG